MGGKLTQITEKRLTRFNYGFIYGMIIWPSAPKASRDIIIDVATKSRADKLPEMFLLFVRGYRMNSMGVVGKNDRGIYDDAVFIVGPNTFKGFNANTDPSKFKSGVATVLPGWYKYKKGNHGISKPGGGYPAFRPATKNEELPVKRDGESNVPSKINGVATNIHRGGLFGTSSLGCLTIHPSDWNNFYKSVSDLMDLAKSTTIDVGIVEGPIN